MFCFLRPQLVLISDRKVTGGTSKLGQTNIRVSYTAKAYQGLFAFRTTNQL